MIEYEITDIEEKDSYVGIYVDYWINGIKNKTQFSFNPSKFYGNKDNCLKQIENHFNRLKKSLDLKKNMKKKDKDSIRSLIGKKKKL